MRLARFFIYSSAVILLITAGAKFMGSAGHKKILMERDPIIGISIRNLILVAASIELAVAVICFYTKEILMSAMLIAWLSTNLLGYRIILALISYKKPCSCLGNLTDALHITPQTADTGMKIILAYLLLGSYTTLFWIWRQRRQSVSCSSEMGVGG
jgi:hypothetical protein